MTTTAAAATATATATMSVDDVNDDCREQISILDIIIITDDRFIIEANTNNTTHTGLLLLPINVYHDAIEEDKILQHSFEKKLGWNKSNIRKVSWSDKEFDWTFSSCNSGNSNNPCNKRIAIFRSCWDYVDHAKEWNDWLLRIEASNNNDNDTTAAATGAGEARASTTSIIKYINPIELIKWNMDKHYLHDLQSRGINIPQTYYIEKKKKIFGNTRVMDVHGHVVTVGENEENSNHDDNSDDDNESESAGSATDDLINIHYLSLVELYNKFCKEWNTKELILKPCIGGSARHVYKLNKENVSSYDDMFQSLISLESFMIQPFLYNIVKDGELSLVVIGGKVTHAVLKKAKKEGDDGDGEEEFRVQSDFGGTITLYEASQQQIEFAENIVQSITPLPYYARVDIVKDNNGQWTLIELELIEPELWFRLYPKSADILVDYILSKEIEIQQHSLKVK